MNTYLMISAALGVFVSGLHFFVGGRNIAQPLLSATSLTDQVRCIQYFCWHITTLALILIAVLFGVAAFDINQINLAYVGVVFTLSIAILGIMIPIAFKIGYKTMPQGWLFPPIFVFGVLGILQ